jgi:PAS domain S-box-containing protein
VNAEVDDIHVLIVDPDVDEATLLEACLREGLEEPGLVVRHAASTAAARDAVEATEFDVLLLSLRAGDEGAFPFIAALRERSAPIPAVVLTGRTNANSGVRALRAGAFEVLVKPNLTPASLAATVRYAMQLEESRRKETAAERALRRAERQAEALVASSLDIVSIVDADGVVRFASPSVERLLGYPPERLVGRAVLGMVRAGDVPKVAAAFRRSIEEPAAAISVEYEVQHADGSVRRLESLATNLLADPAVAGLVVTSRDVTERHRAEDELRRLSAAVEQSVSIIFLTDPAGNITYINPSFTRTYGYTREEAVGANPRLLKSGRHSAALYQELWRTILSGESFRSEFVNRARDGRIVIVRISVGPIRDRSGAVTGFLAVQDDITDRSVMAERLRVAQKMEAVGHLAREVAHELESVISGLLEEIGAAEAQLPAGSPATALLASARGRARRGAGPGAAPSSAGDSAASDADRTCGWSRATRRSKRRFRPGPTPGRPGRNADGRPGQAAGGRSGSKAPAATKRRNSSSGTGLFMKYPWASSQPWKRRKEYCRFSSTPSATTFSPSPRDIPITVLTIAAADGSVQIPPTKPLSIFRRLSGNLRRYPSDE